jgi:DNA-directed RNA polymerase specialized sigma24 family protein
MTGDAFVAVQLLQKLSCKYFYSSPYWTERTDRAIDTILRNPHCSGNPSHLVRNALSDARKILHRRSQICSLREITTCEDDNCGNNIELVADPRNEKLEEVFTVKDWFERASLSSQERVVLTLLLNESEAKEIAEELGITVQQARVRISHARKRAKTCWEADTDV